MDLDEIVAGSMLFANLALAIDRAFDRVAVQRRSRGNQPRAEAPAIDQLLAQYQVRGLTQHAANRCYAIGNEQREDPVQFARTDSGHMRVHFGKTRHQVAIRAVDDLRIVRNRY